MKAIISVSNKAGIAQFAQGLQDLGIEVFSTGGTKKALEAVNINVRSITELTGFPEILDGRVKTLHPAIHGGILARRDNSQHMAALEQHHISLIDIVVVNLYPFIETVSKDQVSLDEALENIDIGGPTLIRSAAKNFSAITVIVDPKDYDAVLKKLKQGNIDLETKKSLAQKAFQHVAIYDTAISQYLRQEKFPQEMTIALKKDRMLRYGENPHQKASLYLEQNVNSPQSILAKLEQLNGPEISFTNLLDIDAAINILKNFTIPTIAILKHNNSCGLSSHNNLAQAYLGALSGDPVAAFGGVVASNRVIDPNTAEEINKTHFDAIVAPGYHDMSLQLLGRKKSLRLIKLPIDNAASEYQLEFRHINGGFLAQIPDFFTESDFNPRVVSDREPSETELSALRFAWKAVKGVKSNAITIAKGQTLLGIGAGQPSRVASVEIALKIASDRAQGAVLASDAFFPFPDGPELAAAKGITAIIQPGGSIRDNEVIKIVNQHKMAMVFTGTRHFRH